MEADLLAFHAARVKRMLADLQLDPGSLFVASDQAIVDDLTHRRLTQALGNQTLAEGLVAAVKIAALVIEGA